MAVQKKKDGYPSSSFFDSLETIASFETVKTWLNKHHKKVGCGARLVGMDRLKEFPKF